MLLLVVGVGGVLLVIEERRLLRPGVAPLRTELNGIEVVMIRWAVGSLPVALGSDMDAVV